MSADKQKKMANQSKKTRFAPKHKIKKGDRVFVISGAYKDRERSREVLEVIPDKDRVVVDGVNLRKKHSKPTQDSPGGINEITASIHISNLMLEDPKTGEPTRIGRKVVDGKIVRYSKSSGEIIK